jgi:hypothetical protein
MRWVDIWRFIRSWEGIVPSAIAVVAAIYYGPKKMLEVWDWYVDRFVDRDVLLIIKGRKIVPTTFASERFAIMRTEMREAPYTAAEIATELRRNEKSVSKSLRRLYAHDKIEKYEWGWRLKT